MARLVARMLVRPLARGLAAGLVVAALAGPAHARSEKTLAYPAAQAWPTTVRFLVVDERVKVTEKDPDAGYLLFELREDGKVFRGSLEVMTVTREGRASVRFVLQIEDRPDWIEVAMLTRLERKLRAELGAPSPPPTKKGPTNEGKDGGKDGGGKDGAKEPPKVDEGGPPISSQP